MGRVEVHARRTLLDGFFRVEEVDLSHERTDGSMSPSLTRLNVDRGDGAAVVLHDPERRVVVLVRQFRFSAWENGPGWLHELVAGTVPQGQSPEDVARTECLEEAGYEIDRLDSIGSFYLTPGGSSERIFLYYAAVSAGQRRSPGGGLEEEGESIEVLEWPEANVWAALDAGRIADAKTLVGLMWLRRLFS